jgi:hypothetical protein
VQARRLRDAFGRRGRIEAEAIDDRPDVAPPVQLLERAADARVAAVSLERLAAEALHHDVLPQRMRTIPRCGIVRIRLDRRPEQRGGRARVLGRERAAQHDEAVRVEVTERVFVKGRRALAVIERGDAAVDRRIEARHRVVIDRRAGGRQYPALERVERRPLAVHVDDGFLETDAGDREHDPIAARLGRGRTSPAVLRSGPEALEAK